MKVWYTIDDYTLPGHSANGHPTARHNETHPRTLQKLRTNPTALC